MPSITVLISLTILVVSFLSGFIFFYLTNPEHKKIKKQQADTLISLFINFIIYIWIGKVLVNVTKFIVDPLAILAYPSNATAFYCAIVLTSIHIVYWKVRNIHHVTYMLYSFIPVFLGASFMYELLQVVIEGNDKGWMYLTLLLALLIIYVLMLDKLPKQKSSFILLTIWLVGQFLLAISFSYTTIFGYMIVPHFFIILFIVVLIWKLYSKKRRLDI